MLTKRKRRSKRDPVPERLRAFACILALLLLPSAVFAQGGATGESPNNVLGDVIIVSILVLITGLFVLAETALLTVRRTRIEQLVEEGNRSAKLVGLLLSEPTRMLATLQVGLTLVQLFSAGEAATKFVEPFTKFLKSRGTPDSFLASHAPSISFVTIILGVSLLTLVIGEITPKSLAIRHAERIALLAAWPVRWLQVIARPIVSLVTLLSNLIVRPFGGTATFHAAALSEEELKLMVEQSEEHGVIEAEEKEMIHKVFEFADTMVRKVMTPRLDITAVEADVDAEELIRVVTESGHSRLPVYDDDLDNIVGIVHVKDVLQAITQQMLTTNPPSVNLRDLMRPPYFIPENKRVDDLLRDLRRSRTQMAIVRDEYGTVTGIVTIEDILEEIVGEIQDEYDREEPLMTQVDARTCIIDARMSLEDFNDRMGVELPMEESDTVGGFVFGLVGHQPEHGEAAHWDGLEFRIEATDGRRIEKVRVIKAPTPEPADSETKNGAPSSSSETESHGSASSDRLTI